MVDLQQADLKVEEIYNIIKSQESGITLDAVAKQYPPQDPTVPYSVAKLLADGKVKTEMRGEKLYCVTIETEIKKHELHKGEDISCKRMQVK